MQNKNLIIPGIYRHYKGNKYEVIGMGKHTETEEDVVVYRPVYKSEIAYWIRPYEMFISDVMIDGVAYPRFSRIDE
jgi:hypothetical protein